MSTHHTAFHLGGLHVVGNCDCRACKPDQPAAPQRVVPRTSWRNTLVGLVLLSALLASAGCQRTTFSQPPVTSQTCDTALQGAWVSVDKRGKPDGEITATLTQDCRLHVVEQRSDGALARPAITVASQRIGSRNALWLDAAEVNRAYDIDTSTVDHDGAVYVFVYTIDGERLDLLQPDHRRLAHRVVDGKLEGAVLIDGSDIAVRIDGDQAALAKLLRE